MPRRKLNFRLRFIFAVTLLAAAVMALFANTSEERAAFGIAELNGSFEIEYRGPHWVQRWFGRNLRRHGWFGPFDNIVSVRLGFQGVSGPPTAVTDEWLVNLNDNPHLVSLSLSGSQVTDDGILKLKGLPNVSTLDLAHLKISNASIEHLYRFPALRDLRINNTLVDDAGLKALAHLPNIELLCLDSTAITDAGVDALLELKKLRRLDLYNTSITHDGYSKLRSGLPNATIDY